MFIFLNTIKFNSIFSWCRFFLSNFKKKVKLKNGKKEKRKLKSEEA